MSDSDLAIKEIDQKIQKAIELRYSKTNESNQLGIDILEKSIENEYIKGIIYGKLIIAISNFINSSDDKVFEFLMDAYEYFQKNTAEKGFYLVLDNLGAYYDNQGEYEKALQYLNEGLNDSKATDAKEGEADILSTLGKVYLRIQNYSKAVDTFSQSLKIRENLGLKKAAASSFNLLGRAYCLLKEYNRAYEFYDQSIQIRKELNDMSGIVWSYIGMASMFELQKEYPKSILYYKKAIDYNIYVKDLRSEFHISKGLGDIYLEQSDYELAKDQILPLEQIAEKLSSNPLLYQAYEQIAHYYEKIKDSDQAYRYLKKYTKLKDEVLNTTTQNRIANKQAELEIINAKKEAEIYQLKNVELKNAYDKIEEKNNEIIDSIKYAQRIQKALLPDANLLNKYVDDYFIFYKPKDIVSGDFYWFGERNNQLIFVAADCTGHGVPGALLSMLGISFLSEIISNKNNLEANRILEILRNQMISSLKQSGFEGESKDGMDIALCIFDKEKKNLQYSGAYNSLYLIRGNELDEYKADRMPIGYYDNAVEPFTNHNIQLNQGEMIYLFSDGFPDQFGGTEGKKYKYKAFKDLLLSMNNLSMKDQHKRLQKEFEDWKGNYDQVDDVIVLGIKI